MPKVREGVPLSLGWFGGGGGSVSHSLKKDRVLARKRALLMREIHKKGHFRQNRLFKCELDKRFYVC